MTYSLLGAPALAFDLVRRPHGSTVAALLVAALAADSDRLLAVAEDPMHLYPCVGGPPRAGLADGVAESGDPLLGAELSLLLRETTLGHAAGLREFVIDEVLAPRSMVEGFTTDEAASLVTRFADAVMWAWEAGPGAPKAGALPAWIIDLASTVDLGPQADQLRAHLDLISAATAGSSASWPTATASGCEPVAWSTAMHEATWAVQLSGRALPAAVAQLLAVQAYLAGGFTLLDTCQGAWNTLSGEVHALVVADLLSLDAKQVLLPGWPGLRDHHRGVA